jgi:C1A family cysteine protease
MIAMLNKRTLILRLLFSFMGCCLLLAMPFNGLAPVYAADPPAGQEGPVNPDFEAFMVKKLQQASSPQSAGTPSEPFYGYMPHPVNLRQLNDVPVQKPLLQASEVVPGSGSSAMLMGLPASFDWRPLSKVTSIKNQASCGTCWIFGSLAALESRVAIVNSTLYDFSEQNVAACVDPAWTYLINNKCAPGGDSFITFDTLSRKGTRLEACDPYNTTTINSEACNAFGCTTYQQVTGFHIIANSVVTTDEINLVKSAIYNYGPVSMAFYMNSSNLYTSGGYTNVYYGGATSTANHLVSIVGWNDGIPHPAGGGYGAWIVKNSWGTSWANSGYFYMCYGSGNMGEVGSYQGHKTYEPNEKLYTWDEVGWIYSRGWETDYSAWMANVYTATPAGSLTHVDFWATSNNAQYQVNIMSGSFGALLATQSGACTEAGYYSISLNSPVALTAGQQFTVAVKMTTPGYGYPIAVESAYTYATPTIQPNVSFIRHFDTGAWTDLASASRNAVLRAWVNSGAVTATAPAVANLSSGASNITNTTARLNGELISNGNENPTVHIYWGMTDGGTTPANWTYDVNLGQKPAGTFYSDVTGLTAGRTYYYRCYAVNSAGSSWAAASASFIAGSPVKLLGMDDAAASAAASQNYLVMDRYTTVAAGTLSEIRVKCAATGNVKAAIYSDASGSPGSLLAANNTGVNVSEGWNTVSIAGGPSLVAGTGYWIAVNSSAQCIGYTPYSGGTMLFRALGYTSDFPSTAGTGFTSAAGYHCFTAGWGLQPPVIPVSPAITNASGATSVTATSATLNGNLTSTGNADCNIIIHWGATDGDTTPANWANNIATGIQSAPGVFSSPVTGLTTGSTYYYRCFAQNSAGTSWAASSSSFVAQTPSVPVKLLGMDDAATAAAATQNYIVLDRYVASASATVSEIRLKCSASGNVKVAMYSDNAGSPDTLLAANNAGQTVSSGWNTIPLSGGPVITSGNSYWIAANSSSPCIGYTPYSGGVMLFRAMSYASDFPASAGSGFTTSAGYHCLTAGWGASTPLVPPSPPALTAPGAAVTFQWGTSTGATKYWLQVNTAQAFSGANIINTDIGNLTLREVTGFSLGTTYYWRVRAGNDGGWGNWSATRSITVNQLP